MELAEISHRHSRLPLIGEPNGYTSRRLSLHLSEGKQTIRLCTGYPRILTCEEPMEAPMQRMMRSTGPTTVAMCGGLGATYLLLADSSPTAIYFTAATGVMLVLSAGLVFESGGNLRALIRTDVVMLAALYGVTLVELPAGQPSPPSVNSLDGPQQ